jgi:hypothetical protein
LINFFKKLKIAKNNENPPKIHFDIFASFLAFEKRKNLKKTSQPPPTID